MKAAIIPDAKSSRHRGTFTSRSAPAEPEKFRVPRFALQPTLSFEHGAPQPGRYTDDEAFADAVRIYRAEWRQEYECCDLNCGNLECPQHHAFPETAETPAPASSGSPALNNAEVKRIAKVAEAWRTAHGLTDTAFVARFRPYLIDSRSWWLVKTKPFSEWDKGRGKLIAGLPGLLPALADEDRAGSLSPLIETVHTQRFCRALEILRQQREEKRCVFILGPTGSGKSSTLRLAESRLQNRKIVRLRGREAWKSPREYLADWGAALNVDLSSSNVAGLQTQVRDAILELRDAIIFIDEGHRLTAAGINMLIDWVNDCVGDHGNSIHFVLAAVDTLWTKLSQTAQEEADQLRINRGLDVIYHAPPNEEEIALLLNAGCACERQLGAKPFAQLLPILAGHALTSGSRAYVRDVRAIFAPRQTLTFSDAKEIAASVAAKNRLAQKRRAAAD